MTRPTGEDAMSSEHVEVLERLRGVLEHGKMGDKCLIAPDLVTAAIASLSAPQPPAEPDFPPNTPIAELLADYEANGCDHTDLHWVRESARRYVETMPDSQARCLLHVLAQPASPSAPVGVEALPEGWMRDRKEVVALAEHLEGLGWKPDERGDVQCFDQGSAMAAEVIRDVLIPILDGAQVASLAQQPAAEDGAMVERAWIAFCENNGSARQGIRAALTAALAGHQGGES